MSKECFGSCDNLYVVRESEGQRQTETEIQRDRDREITARSVIVYQRI